jgi:hypothetical protein
MARHGRVATVLTDVVVPVVNDAHITYEHLLLVIPHISDQILVGVGLVGVSHVGFVVRTSGRKNGDQRGIFHD